jgi:Ca-activated chloride channel family protein
MRKGVFFLLVLVCSLAVFGQYDPTEGSLYAVGKSGKELGTCPLKGTEVDVEISGFMSRVKVRQEFVNSYPQPIEAVYMFPLPEKGAVDRMTMTVGDRVMRGRIMKREEARETYETAKSEGKVASLLDQENENVFTQSVANIMPGERVVIEISYVETLKYEDGAYEFVFPMVVAPRRGSPAAAKPARLRSGSDISIEVNLDAGVPVEQIRSLSHQIDQINMTPNTAKVKLHGGKTLPNKDFVLRYDVTGKRIEDAVLAHRDARGGFFTMILQPPDVPAADERTPKEIVFVLDTSGSMDGFPIEKAKEAMGLSLDGLHPDDTFNLITFAGDTDILFDRPVPATQANLQRARAFIADRNREGGTEMMAAIKASLEPSDSQEHLRIVCFMTDGQVSNEDEIVAEVKKHPRARVYSFGIGGGVNRSLLDRIAQEGKGEATYVGLSDDGSKAAKKFYERVRTPLLTDLSIDWNGMPVTDVYPSKLTDLFSAKPVTVTGRYTKPAKGSIKLRGFVAGQPYEREIPFNLPESESENDALASLWARSQITEISAKRLNEAGSMTVNPVLEKQIADLGLEYGLVTEFTSFVAVEDKVVNQNGSPVRVEVPLVQAGGGDGEDVVRVEGSDLDDVSLQEPATLKNQALKGKRKRLGSPDAKLAKYTRRGRGAGTASGAGGGAGGGMGYGSGNGMGSGVGSGSGSADASPPPPASVPLAGAVAPELAVTVDVTAAAPVLNASASQVSTSISGKQIQTLPIQGHSFSSLLTLVPGTVRREPLSSGFQIDGASGTENTFTIEGDLSGGSTASSRDVADSNGRVILAVKPDSPGVGRTQEVPVEIEVDVTGIVVSATASGATPRLRAASEAAAKLTRFASPVAADGKPIRIKGALVYRFEKGGKVSVGLRGMKSAPTTAADTRAIALSSKLHVWLFSIVERHRAGGGVVGENEKRFVSAGRAFVKVSLKERTPAALAKLKAAGFDIARPLGKSQIEGRIGLDKIADLALMDEVLLIVPRV